MTWNDTNKLPFKLFWWQSPDGSKVLTYFPDDYANNNLNPVRLSSDLAQARQRSPGMDNMMDLYGIGDHGGGPTRAILDEGNHWAQPDKIMPKIHFGTAQSFFTNAEQKVSSNSPEWNYESIAKGYTFPTAEEGKIDIPTWKDEMYFEYHRGVMTTQANHKRNMRKSEEQTLNAEKYASLAWLQGDTYPNQRFTDAWKKSPSTTSTISPPAPASASSTKRRSRTTTRSTGPPARSPRRPSHSRRRRPTPAPGGNVSVSRLQSSRLAA